MDEAERADRRAGYADARAGRTPQRENWRIWASYSRGYREGLREGFLPDVTRGRLVVRGISAEQAIALAVELRHDERFGMASFEAGPEG